jgi:quercetin dioxygenase-like cupin family protein
VSDPHPYKTVAENVSRDTSLTDDRGWHDMDVRWLITRESMGSDLTVVGQTFFPPGAKHAMHRHPHAEEWELVLEGEGIKHVGDDSFHLKVGEVAFIPRNVYHGLENASDTKPLVSIWGYCGVGSLEEAGYVLPSDDEENAA